MSNNCVIKAVFVVLKQMRKSPQTNEQAIYRHPRMFTYAEMQQKFSRKFLRDATRRSLTSAIKIIEEHVFLLTSGMQ